MMANSGAGTPPANPILSNILGNKRTRKSERIGASRQLKQGHLSHSHQSAHLSPHDIDNLTERRERSNSGTREYDDTFIITPNTSDHIEYYSELRRVLNGRLFKRRVCCEVFLEEDRKMKLLKYHRDPADGLDRLAEVVRGSLYSAKRNIKVMKKSVQNPKSTRWLR